MPEADPVSTRSRDADFRSATHRLVDAITSTAPALAGELTDFAARPVIDDGAPRSVEELFAAQRLARALLIESKDYDAVYRWYGAFKEAASSPAPPPIDVLAASAVGCRDSFGFIQGFGTVLEIGAGDAPIGLVLADGNASWIATDVVIPDGFDAVADHIGRPTNLVYEQADAVHLDVIGDGSVDVVVSRSFIEHLLVDDVHRFLRECHRVLEPGGTLVVFCPSSVSPPSEITRHFSQYRSVQGLHMKEWTVSELAVVLGEHGFTNVRSRFVSCRGLGRLPLPVQRRNAIDVKVAIRLEGLARRTNGMAYAGGWRARTWNLVWGHLGAASTSVTATRAA